jgi:hypothetical protein
MSTKTAVTTDPDEDALAQLGTLTPRRDRMKRSFALLLMTTGLCAGLGTGSAVLAAGQSQPLTPAAGLTSRIAPDARLTLIDDDGDEGKPNWFWSLSGEDDGDDECEDDDEGGGEGGDNCTAGAAGNAARAGTVAPPKNGLFTNGAAPVVKSN